MLMLELGLCVHSGIGCAWLAWWCFLLRPDAPSLHHKQYMYICVPAFVGAWGLCMRSAGSQMQMSVRGLLGHNHTLAVVYVVSWIGSGAMEAHAEIQTSRFPYHGHWWLWRRLKVSSCVMAHSPISRKPSLRMSCTGIWRRGPAELNGSLKANE